MAGNLALPPRGRPKTPPRPLGVLAHRANNFDLDHLRIIGTGQAIRSKGSSA